MKEDQELKDYLSETFALTWQGQPTLEQLREVLAVHINHLIQVRFHELVGLLYRVDISESRLRTMLADHQDVDAGQIIASMIIDRQLQKMETRKKFRQTGEIPDDEKW
jgi:hypothetical protein